MYMETPTAYGPTGSDACSVSALHFQLVLVILVSTCSTASPLVLDVGPLASPGITDYSFIAICRHRGSKALTLARTARVMKVCAQMLERTGSGAAVPEIPESPATRMGGHSVEGRTVAFQMRSWPRQASGNALPLGIAVWSREHQER